MVAYLVILVAACLRILPLAIVAFLVVVGISPFIIKDITLVVDPLVADPLVIKDITFITLVVVPFAHPFEVTEDNILVVTFIAEGIEEPCLEVDIILEPFAAVDSSLVITSMVALAITFPLAIT